ncbi:MAG: hypothetical protein ABSD62_02910 [Candidatus Limnocylindrales bacterium]
MFWNRAAREARRGKVLDDLIELTPEERRLRMDLAVAEGDVRAGEVEQALRLISRLDALRVMTIPGTREAAPSIGAKADEPTGLAPLEAVNEPPKRARRRVAIDVTPEPLGARVPEAVLPRRNRSIAREVAVRKASRAIGGSPRRRRLRLAASVRAQAPTRAAISAEVAGPADAQLAVAPAPEASSEEQWPSISWLRP